MTLQRVGRATRLTVPLQHFGIGVTEIAVWPDCVQTIIETQGRKVEICAADHSDVVLARQLGYGDNTWLMTVDHEVAHTWLAWVFGRRASPVLLNKGMGRQCDVWTAWEEENVLTFQRGLDKEKERPWERWARGV
jgi:hypothetical protein